MTVPKSWTDLNNEQLQFVFTLIADGYSSVDIRTKCLLKWSGARVLGKKSNLNYLQYKDDIIAVTSDQINSAVDMMSWIDNLPMVPICISNYQRHNSIPANFEGVPFEKYMICDNLYQGYLATKQEYLLDELGKVLYNSNSIKKFLDFVRISIFYWFASVKQYFTRLFPHFMQPIETDTVNLLGNSNNRVVEAMNAQIRALTKGDVTKEKEVLSLDTHRALTELDAQAREYEEFNQKYANK